jgi:hypothetical protein
MQGVLACIDANGVSDCSGCLMGHGDVLLVLLSPRSSSERFGAGARPVHPIRVGSLRRTDSVAVEGIADIGEALLPVGATRMTHLRHGRLKTFAAQKDYSFLR